MEITFASSIVCCVPGMFLFNLVESNFCFRLLGAESLQGGNQISVSGVCRIVSCILHNEKLTEV